MAELCTSEGDSNSRLPDKDCPSPPSARPNNASCASASLSTGKRPDGRTPTEIRPIWCEVGLSPRAHGSGLFTRGETQVLSFATLGTLGEAQELDNLSPDRQQALHAPLQLPALLHGRGQASARPEPPRGRARRAGRARPRAGHPRRGDLPLHHPRRLRGAVLQRLHLDGLGLRLDAGADGCRCADQGARGRRGHGPHHRRDRPLPNPDRHPGHRRPPRRHGLQGRRHRPGHHRPADGHQDHAA